MHDKSGLNIKAQAMINSINTLIDDENHRQQNTISLIASENHCSENVRMALGSRLTDKYIEGKPGARYYNGCQVMDDIESICIHEACSLFNANWANVQPHSGSQANQAVFSALLKPGDKILGMSLQHGGHLTHGSKVNFSGKIYNAFHYGVDDKGLLDYDRIRDIVEIVRPKLIIAGASAYSRVINWPQFREIADSVGAYLLCDIAHYAGLIAGNAYPNPIEHAHVITSTTHKVLRGPRGGIIMSNDEELGRKIDKSVFPGTQGGAMAHVIAAKAICFAEAKTDEYKTYAYNVVQNARAMCNVLSNLGWRVISGGTDSHLINIDLSSKCSYLGRDAANILEQYGLIVNMECIPHDTRRPPQEWIGIRLGTAAMTSRGMGLKEAEEIAYMIDKILMHNSDDLEDKVIENIKNLCMKFKLR